jgi:ribose transport system permease protein
MYLSRIDCYLLKVVLCGLLFLAVLADQIRLRYVASLND